MMLSQNGWPVATVADVHYYPLVGGTVALRKGTVATVLLALAADLQKLQPAVWPGIWGWFVRPIRGQTTGYSNHASATAMDWNAPQHARQSRSRYLGWSTAQVNAIHALLAGKYAGVIRWGGDYHTAPYDPMHFEINASAAAVAALAHRLTPSPAPHHEGLVTMLPVLVKNRPELWITNGVTRRWISNAKYRDWLIKVAAISGSIGEVDDITALVGTAGPIDPLSPVPPGWVEPKPPTS